MNAILEKIYEDVLVNEDEAKILRKSIDEFVKKCVANYAKALSLEEQEELSCLLFASCYTAEKVGFEIGVWFMFQLCNSYMKSPFHN